MKLILLRGVVIDSGNACKAGDKVEVSDKFGTLLINSGKARKDTSRKKKKDD